MKKNIDLDKRIVQDITIQAIKEGTVFKLKAQQVLVDYAKSLNKKSKGKTQETDNN